MLIERESPITGKKNIMDIPVTTEQLQAWAYGSLIQDVMPDLTPAQREFLISGITPEEWEETFAEEEEED